MTSLVRRPAAGRTDVADDQARFLEGIALGALVGAAIAGSTLWTRWHNRNREREAGPEG